jgi:hypothetical protein
MNKLELFVYDLVKDRPVLKQRIVDFYQTALGLIPQKAIATDLPIVQREGFFFGFHDKTPFSADGSLLLAHRNLIGNRLVQDGDLAEVGVFAGPLWTDWRLLGRTDAWNWQLGSMLQWLGADGRRVVHNVVANGRVCAEVRDLEGRRLALLRHPVVHATSDGRLASSYNFARVEAGLPGYGVVTREPKLGTEEDAFRIFRCDDGMSTFEMSLKQAMGIEPHDSMRGAFHFFHHSLFGPGDQRAFFLHRWLDGNRRLWSRMFSVGADGSGLYLFPMNEMVSHITWASETEIFAYARYPGSGDGYYLLHDQTGSALRLFAQELNSDGHPTMDKLRNIVLTDTYPDRFRNQYLVLGRVETQKTIRLCRTHLPRSLRDELRVDLHPRLHPTRPLACFDSGHSGGRSLVTLDFSSVLQ